MIGIDIASIERFKKIGEEDFASWRRTFSESEWQYSFSRANPAECLAGIFAAKEAIMKALGGEFVGRFDLIEITHLSDGMPIAKIKNVDDKKVHISVSHDGGMAVAVAVIAS